MTRFEPPLRTGDPYRRRERVYAHEHNAPQRSGQVLLAIGLAIAAFLFVGACSFTQASSEDHALGVIRATVASTTQVELLVAVELEDIRSAGQDDEPGLVTVSGFPFDAVLTQDEARDLPPDQISARLLDQASSDVYARGLEAFNSSGDQDIDSLTAQGMLNRILGTLTDDNHRNATIAAWVLFFLTVTLGVLAVAMRRGARRFLVLGGSLALAGCLGLIASGMALLTVRVLGGDSDPFVSALRSLVESVIEVPLRNYTVLAVLGAAIWAIAPILALLERQSPPGSGEAYEEWDATDGEVDWDEEPPEVRGGWGRGRA